MLKTKKQTVLNHINCAPSTNIKVIPMKAVCRICLNSDGSQYTDIFSVKFTDQTTLTDLVCKLTQIQIVEDDGYPQKICNECIDRYTDSYNLCHVTKESFEKLKSILSTKMTKKSKSTELELVADKNISETSTYFIEINDPEEVSIEPVLKKNKVVESPEPEVKIVKVNKSRQDRGIKTTTEKNNCNSSIKAPTNTDIDGVNFLMTFIDKTAKEDTSGLQNIEYEKRPYACKICNKRFLKRSNLLDHLRLHANVKNFKCPYCEKSFVQSGNYKSHIRVHTNERPYSCTVCTKSYQQSSALKIHMRSHTNEKKYICDKCQKGFTNSSDLSKHKLIHDEVKKYKCEKCDRGFSQKIHLTKHLEKGRCSI